eukprot:TRINITY_DN17603_c0_g1_i1.p1 TRINITY_DN17603_c0_g1~~TRINITY_DN17603_c0_g1_i1.p1  ORF type:complete len:554 (+),score=76.01 TRINITY_DN17603_c0_g1_i1:49-1710(+)
MSALALRGSYFAGFPLELWSCVRAYLPPRCRWALRLTCRGLYRGLALPEAIAVNLGEESMRSLTKRFSTANQIPWWGSKARALSLRLPQTAVVPCDVVRLLAQQCPAVVDVFLDFCDACDAPPEIDTLCVALSAAWPEMTAFASTADVGCAAVQAIVSSATNMRRIDLCFASALPVIASHCTRLTSLRLASGNPSPEVFDRVVQSCSSLTELHLPMLTAQNLRAAVRGLPGLRKFTFRGVYANDEMCIGEECSRVESLSVLCAKDVTSVVGCTGLAELRLLLAEAPAAVDLGVLAELPHLRRLGVFSAFADHMLAECSSTLTNLVSLSVSWGGNLTQIISRCPQLQELTTTGMTYEELIAALEAAPQLRRLELHQFRPPITEQGATALASRCAGLRHLNLQQPLSHSTAFLVALARLQRQPLVLELSLPGEELDPSVFRSAYLHFDFLQAAISEAALRALAANSSAAATVQSLSLAGSTVSAAGFLLACKSLPSLISLELVECVCITSDAFTEAMTALGCRLRYVRVLRCQKIAASACDIANACPWSVVSYLD